MVEQLISTLTRAVDVAVYWDTLTADEIVMLRAHIEQLKVEAKSL